MSRISDHIERCLNQVGRKVWLGSQQYKVRGYISNNFSVFTDHEPYLVAAMQRALSLRTGTFVDVGANLGQTLQKLLAIEPDREYLGFEPQIACCFFIDRFLSDNAIRTATILPIALSNTNSAQIFHSDGEADVMGSFIEQPDRKPDRKYVQARVGDELLAEIGCSAPAIIKIDVEGAELKVLEGLHETLATARPIIFFELLPNFEGHERTMLPSAVQHERLVQADRIRSLFDALKYDIYQIDSEGAEHRISRFELNDAAAFIGNDYVAYPR